MKTAALAVKLHKKSANLDSIAEDIIKRPASLPEVYDGLRADSARVKFGCLKVLRLVSERKPEVLYPLFDRFVALLDSDNNILKWGAIILLGNLAAVDTERKIERILDRYLLPVSGPVMITAANVVRGAAKMAKAQPHLADRIARALLQVEAANYQTAECRNVALGHVVESLELLFDQIGNRPPVLEFVRRQLKNPRPAVRRKAERFLSHHERS
jgi:hypothetical protein